MRVNRSLKFHYWKVIITTGLVWMMMNALLLNYVTDCPTVCTAKCNYINGSANRGDYHHEVLKAMSKQEDNAIKQAATASKTYTTKKQHAKVLKDNKQKHIRNSSLLQGPGEMGKAVVIPKEREAEAKEKFKINQFNLVASDMISLDRSLPDYRMDACQKKQYPPLDDLPNTSVIIVYHNEAWSTLLRTVHSVINRSPRQLLEEIILVDDGSDQDHLGKQLDDYVKTLDVKVKVFRSTNRIGAIRARLKGVKESQGDTITVLDSHCECTEGWLEPLLYEIYKDRTAVVCPIIDAISDDTFEYFTASDMTWGGFSWEVAYAWYHVPQREVDRREGDHSKPVKPPTMAVGLFTFDRQFFLKIGAYDEDLIIWGAENLDMSFNIWLCGGQILKVTCSRVGHVFRKKHPYSWPSGAAWRDFMNNTQRVAEVWMDEYKEFFYKLNPAVKRTGYGDISKRLELRKRLKCHSFRWYLENVYPESPLLVDFYSLGEIRNKDNNMCIDGMGRKSGETVGIVTCHGMGGQQIFSYTKKKAIQTDILCLDVSSISGPVKLCQCNGLGGNQTWEYDIQKLTLQHVNTILCLGTPSVQRPNTPSLGRCTGLQSQQWLLGDMKWKKGRIA